MEELSSTIYSVPKLERATINQLVVDCACSTLHDQPFSGFCLPNTCMQGRVPDQS